MTAVMRAKKQRHLSPAGFAVLLVIIIAAIFIADAVIRLLQQTAPENIVGTGSFSMSGTNTGNSTDPAETVPADGEVPPADAVPSDATILQLTAADQANGPLILVDAAHPYTGGQTFASFADVSNANVKPRDASLSIQSEALDPLATMFDSYATANGSTNLQIDSTTDATLSLYSNVLPDRSCGYAFDIGLITSTGEVVPYIKKNNEWMTANSWAYGFVVRYPSDKTEVTGIEYAPHHFRYVGKVHAEIMHDNNFCLEEYLNYLQTYTMASGGLAYTDDTQSYTIYYVPADPSGTTTVELPKDTAYSVSGDNRGGFIITVTGTPEVPAATTEAPVQ